MIAARIATCCLTGLFAAAALTFGCSAAFAQDPLALVNKDTQVRSIEFRFDSTQTLDKELFLLNIATRAPQRGLLVALGIQGVPLDYPFSPIEAKKDVVRLTRYFQDNGFPRVEVNYDVEFSAEENTARVAFVIDEGPPQRIEDITFGLPGSGGPASQLPPDLRPEWDAFVRSTILGTGTRFDEFSLVSLQNKTLGWFSSRGYPFAYVGAERFVGDDGLTVTIRLKAIVGPRAVVGEINVDGLGNLAERVITRELPFQPGDRFDSRQLGEAQREIFGLNLFQLALVGLAPDQPSDSTVAVDITLKRGPSRVLTGFGGYFSEGGLTGRGQLTHRNIFGGAQALTLGVEWRTGWFSRGTQAASGNAITDLRASLSLRQPYVFDRRLSGTLQPSLQQRDDEIENSRQAELTATLLYARSAIRTAALSLGGRYREVLLGQGLRILDPESILNTSSLSSQTGGIGLDVTWGSLDDQLQPRSGFVIRPSISGASGSVAFLRSRLSGTLLVPVGRRVGVVARVTGGTIQTLAPNDSSIEAAGADYLRLRDVLFYAGGTSDVRGWGSAQLGPKALTISRNEDGAIVGPGDISTVGIGGSAKASASIQLNLPLPIGPKWGTNIFVDAGRVWDPNAVPLGILRQPGDPAGLALADKLDEERRVRVGAGIGIQYLTPVGYVSVALAAKLNPSYLDRRRASDILCGTAVQDVFDCTGNDDGEIPGYLDARQGDTGFDPDAIPIPTSSLLGIETRRLNIHLTIGQTF